MTLAMLGGTAVGLFVGESAAWLDLVGNITIELMKMTVFPYIVVSLVYGLGRLELATARELLLRPAIMMLLLWLFGVGTILLFFLCFPALESASFFSISSITPAESVDYLKLYIPSNPFESMARGHVPAMMLFSIAVGLTLIGFPDEKKTIVINVLALASEIFTRINHALVRVLPIGIFAMTASATGTMGLNELINLQAYLVVAFALHAVLGLFLFPWLISCFTPLSLAEASRVARPAVIAAFSTGNVFIVLPVIIEECRKVLESKGIDSEKAGQQLGVLVPIFFGFPQTGKFCLLLFAYFGAWFAGIDVSSEQILALATTGIMSLFGSAYLAVPAMLNLVQAPSDLFHLFVLSGLVTGRIGAVVAVANLSALALLSVALLHRKVSWAPRSWLRLGVGSLPVVLVTIICVRLLLLHIVEPGDTREVIAQMDISENARFDTPIAYAEESQERSNKWRTLDEILEQGVLRVGYRPNNVPFSYINKRGDLVGFDVQMAQLLAADMQLDLEFVAFEEENLVEDLNRGIVDVAMSGLYVDAHSLSLLAYSDTVMELNYAVVMRDHLVAELDGLTAIKALGAFRVAHVELGTTIERVKESMPDVRFTAIPSYEAFFTQNGGQWDALLISAQAGSAWTLMYPEYGVLPLSRQSRFPAAYGMARDNLTLMRYLNNWLQLRSVGLHRQRAYDYWILGKGTDDPGPRWSIVRDVLKWTD